MRETTIFEGFTVDEYLEHLRSTDANAYIEQLAKIKEVRLQKDLKLRPKPSTSLIGNSKILTSQTRADLLDKIADLVDENVTGRSDMCQQFALLLHKSLKFLNFSSSVVTGSVTYFDTRGERLYKWPNDGHDWVTVDNELIDGNVDTLFENPRVPDEVKVKPYWGPKNEVPLDRKFHPNPGARTRAEDSDVSRLWWPDLQIWLKNHLNSA